MRGENIALIGMPGAGKSTIGVLFAKKTAMDFVDTDLLIQNDQGLPLQEVLERDGYLGLRMIEERILLNLRCRRHVIATGGSAAYSVPAMKHLKKLGAVVFLDLPFHVIEARVTDYGSRGIARRPDQTFLDLFEERRPMYLRYSDARIACDGLGHEAVCAAIMDACRPFGLPSAPPGWSAP